MRARVKEALYRMRKVLAPVLIASGLLLATTAGVGMADSNLPNIPAHRHFIVAPTGELIAVGPDLCGNPALQQAFNQFHSNVHHAVPGSTGPEVSAPGLHNGYGAELTARSCSFQP